MSNETPNIDVFFDNLQVTHTRGQILEETHYYPFGLTMAGISTRAAGKLDNRYKFNGIEESNDFDLIFLEAYYRYMDVQIGRFLQIDPITTQNESPYVMMGDNPASKVDWLGDYFTWASQNEANLYKRMRQKNSDQLKGYIVEMDNLMKLDMSEQNVQDKIKELLSRINYATELNQRWNEMEESDVEFHVEQVPEGSTGWGGLTSYNSHKNRIDIQLDDFTEQSLAHEIRHGWGYLVGEKVGICGSIRNNPLLDYMDEVVAYNDGFFVSRFKNDDKKVAAGVFTLENLKKTVLRGYDDLKGRDKQLTLNSPAADLLKVSTDGWVINYVKLNSGNANLTIGDVLKASNDLDRKGGRPVTYVFGDDLKNRNK